MSGPMSGGGEIRLPEGGRLYHESHGAGEPLLLLRPLGGSVALWGRFRALLSRRLRVVSFDPRGCGRSGPAPLWMTTRGMARDARDLLAALGIDRAHVFGLSLGGMVAQWLAADAPAQVGRLVLASTAARGLDISGHGALRGLRLARCLLRPPRQAEACLVRRVLSATFRQQHPDEVRRLTALVRAQPASLRGLLAQVAAVAGHDARGQLARIPHQTLVLLGTRDGLLRHEAIADLARSLPAAALQTIEDTGHDLSLEAPEATAAAVLSFVASG